MKKQQNNSTRAWALHVALAIALLSISAVLLASEFQGHSGEEWIERAHQPGRGRR